MNSGETRQGMAPPISLREAYSWGACRRMQSKLYSIGQSADE